MVGEACIAGRSMQSIMVLLPAFPIAFQSVCLSKSVVVESLCMMGMILSILHTATLSHANSSCPFEVVILQACEWATDEGTEMHSMRAREETPNI